MYIGSSASLPVSWSTNPEPIPLICTLVCVSCWMYLTNTPCALRVSNMQHMLTILVAHRWPDNLCPNIKISYRLEADRKLLLGPFSLWYICVSFLAPGLKQRWGERTLSLCRSFLSSTRDPRSISMSSLTLEIASCRISCVFAAMWRYKGGSLSVAFERSGYHVPFVLTDAPVSS